MPDVHVVPDGLQWKVKVAGFPDYDFPTQEDAITAGRDLAKVHEGEPVIHGDDGRIREKDSHGNDRPEIPG